MGDLDLEARELVNEIGKELDAGRSVTVFNGGIVRPGRPSVEDQTPGKENRDAKPRQSRRQTRSTTGSRQGPAARQGAAGGPWSAGRPAPVVEPSIRCVYEAELDNVCSAYPGARIWLCNEGVWLLTESRIVTGLTRKATLLTGIPFSRNARTSAWAYWTTAVSAKWIGPRHTNFPDGSICAFEPKDGTWSLGDGIVKLLDLYTVWTLRHLHFEMLGRWPGFQSVPYAWERLQEFQDDEFCGCDAVPHRRYSECCKPLDQAMDKDVAFSEFLKRYGGIIRQPPKGIFEMIRAHRSHRGKGSDEDSHGWHRGKLPTNPTGLHRKVRAGCVAP